MRRAGYEVRLLPRTSSAGRKSPTLLGVHPPRRPLVPGNLQYWFFLTMPGLKPVSAYQLAFAIWMFFRARPGSGCWCSGTIGVVTAANPSAFMAPGPALAAFVIVMVTWYVPKLATVADVLSRPRCAGFTAADRCSCSMSRSKRVHLLLLPIMWLSDTLFMVNLLFASASAGAPGP